MSSLPRTQLLESQAASRILVLDGAMGTMIQSFKLTEVDYRGTRFQDHSQDLKGNNDLLVLTQPSVIAAIHQQFLDAGADIIETNTFNANAISQADYGLSSLAYELNKTAAVLAREVADTQSEKNPDKPRFVAGALGPTNRTASISPDVNDPGFRNVTFAQLKTAYQEATEGLLDGGADILMIETIFDTLNAKAAIYAVLDVFEARQTRCPVMISGTITDRSGRTLSGQTAEAFWYSVRHAEPWSMGLNCALGAADMRAHVAVLSRVVETRLCVYPNAGLPNEMGGYDETPEQMAAHIKEWATSGFINIVGGCCGTTPAHIAAIAQVVSNIPPRPLPTLPVRMQLSGLEPCIVE